MSPAKASFNNFFDLFPILGRSERRHLITQIEQNAQIKIDFITMMGEV